MKNTATVRIDGNSLQLEDVERVAYAQAEVELSETARAKVQTSRDLVESILHAGKPAYGINTGFGNLAEVHIPEADLDRLQLNLLRSHAVGVGTPLPIPEARALLLLRANVLAKGYSGIRPLVIDRLIEMINLGVVPVIPRKGSVGASGDLAPLAHLALVLIGEGEAFVEGERLDGAAALARVGLAPLQLKAKEGLCLVNGTQAMTALGSLTLQRALRLAELADLAGAMTVEALLGSHRPFLAEVHALRPHPGQVASAAHLRALLADSEIVKSHEHCAKVQDAYSLRCIPQVHGASRDAMRYVRETLCCELNAGTDNPLVFTELASDERAIVSGGNFHGQPIALALDILAIAVSELGSISERRIEQIVNPALSGLPPFLAPNPGLDSGLMMVQVTAAALASENKILCHPASVDSIPSSAGREDHVSMGMIAALKAREVLENTRNILAIELLCAAAALDLRRPLRPGVGVQKAYTLIRKHVAPLTEDRAHGLDIETLSRLVAQDLFS